MTLTALPDLNCTDQDARLALLATATDVHGIDYLEVRPDQRELDVHFVAKTTAAGRASLKAMLDALAAAPGNVTVSGGESVRGIQVVKLRRLGSRLLVGVDCRGDFSTYTLALRNPQLDPPYASVQFSFKAGCPSRFDCAGGCACDLPAPVPPHVDYMAKDCDSFRRALLDRLPAIAPQWLETSEADLGIVLLELLAYAGDQLSYLQDAIANEAYLDSARQRISVRRHARLLDYFISEGASARAFAVAQVSAPCTVGAGTQLLTRRLLPFGTQLPPLPAVLEASNDEQLDQARTDAAAIFETLEDAALHPQLSPIAIHVWDFGDCCLPSGTTTVDLEGDLWFDAADPARQDAWRLRSGSFLVVEEIAGVVTGLPGDADPSHRQVVRLTGAVAVTDPLVAGSLTRVTWADADALRFPLCISRSDAEGVLQTIAVAHANVLVADHGELREQWWPLQPTFTAGVPALGGLTSGARPTTFLLAEGPPSVWRGLADGPVATMNDAQAQLSIWLDLYDQLGTSQSYAPAYDLIGADEFSHLFVPEVTNDGRTSIRFGDDVNGRAPAAGSFVDAHYRVGRGLAGNVGAETLAHILLAPGSPTLPVTLLRNPLPASGGVDPETIQQVKVSAPVAFRAPQQRAVTEADYAEVATRYPGVTQARARFRWTGSWLTVCLIVDAADRDALYTGLAEEVKQFVAAYTQTGYDLEVQPPAYVPLDVELFVCVAGDRFRSDVESDLLTALSSGPLPGGGAGFFAPAALAFGQPLYLSALYAAAAAVPGVESVSATRFSRFYDDDPPPGRPVTAANAVAGLIAAAPLEVLELMNDPSLPERGVLTISTGGGR